MTGSDPYLSVVIPAYNVERLIEQSLQRVVGHLQNKPYSWDVVVADDGSTDRTADAVARFAETEPRVRLLKLAHGGKGWAVKNGMLASSAAWRFMCDADLSMPSEQIDRFLSGEEDPGYDIGIGSREAPGARRFDEPARRHFYGRVFNRVVRMFAVRGLDDTQCGFKMFRGALVPSLFGAQRLSGWGFDVEVLFIARGARLKLREVAIDWYYGRDSKMTLKKGGAAFLEILQVRWHGIRGRYDAARQDLRRGARQAAVPSDRGAAGEAGPRGPQADTRSPKVVAVIPTFNEAGNLPVIVDQLKALGIDGLGFVIVDDSSPDGTGAVADQIAAGFQGFFKVIHRTRKEGLGRAYTAGFREALTSRAEFIVEMDADLSHPPQEVPVMLDKARTADVVAGSRYIKGGAVDPGWNFGRRLLSRFGNLGIKWIVGLKVHDATSGFKVFRRTTLERLEFDRFRNSGYGFQAEVAHWCEYLGLKVVEHPYQFAERRSGKSKMSGRIVLEAILTLAPLRFHRPPKA
ncbi:MAG: glycosyltransferase [Chloroflexi bacterium]|nr:glycosyltransferase [Chloroflexota bacterium]